MAIIAGIRKMAEESGKYQYAQYMGGSNNLKSKYCSETISEMLRQDGYDDHAEMKQYFDGIERETFDKLRG